jgi:hypothetical protein
MAVPVDMIRAIRTVRLWRRSIEQLELRRGSGSLGALCLGREPVQNAHGDANLLMECLDVDVERIFERVGGVSSAGRCLLPRGRSTPS